MSLLQNIFAKYLLNIFQKKSLDAMFISSRALSGQPSHTCVSRRFAVAVLPLALFSQGCAVNPYTDQVAHLKQTFASDDPCASNGRNIGMLAGAVLGAVAGSQLAKKDDRVWAAALGAGLGAGLGNLIGSEIDSRRCALARIQQKYNLDMQVAPLTMKASSGLAAASGSSQVGLSVAVVDSGLRPQFASGSAELGPEARTQFAEIARQYATAWQLAQLGANATPQQREALRVALSKKRVLLVGHTDDSGDTRQNADLSERRAKAVAELFRAQGVVDDQLFYQGAGETLPLADNRTLEGRARNRRVEIVDLSDEDTFRAYLQSRRANTGYYRPAEASGTPEVVTTTNSVTSKPASGMAGSTATKGKAGKVTKSQPAKPQGTVQSQGVALASTTNTATRPVLDFGGVPYSRNLATLNVGSLRQSSGGISISLISQAQASDMSAISSCRDDRPRSAGLVKSLKGNRAYATSEMMPGLYGRTWHDTVNGNLVVLNKVAVLSNGANAANAPELKVYADYDPAHARTAQPTVTVTPAVNTYPGSNGLLYRVFAEGRGGVQCMDILFASQPAQASTGKIVYGASDRQLVADFRPRMVGQ